MEDSSDEHSLAEYSMRSGLSMPSSNQPVDAIRDDVPYHRLQVPGVCLRKVGARAWFKSDG